MSEVVVVGGGLAGCWAAATAARAGATVTLVRRAPGATAMSSGAIDFIPPDEALTASAWLAALPRLSPGHPYLAAGAAPSLEDVEAEAHRLAAALLAAGLPHRADLGAPPLLAALTGQLRRAGVVQETIAAGSLDGEVRRIVVVGVEGLQRLHPGLVAAALGERTRHLVGAITVPPPSGLEDVVGDLDDASLARAVEAPGGAERLGAAIRKAVGPAGADLGLLPAVLGLDDPVATAARVSAAAGLPVAELLSPPPSAPGWRLGAAAERLAADAGVDIVPAAVGGVRVAGGSVIAVELAAGGELPCTVLVMATGKFIGGGLLAGRRLRVALLDLPVDAGGLDAARLGRRDLVDRARFMAQPFLAAGVRVDAGCRPVDRFGVAPVDNLLACGSLLSGLDTTLGHGGVGVAAWTAGRAGRSAAALRRVAA